MEVEDRVVSGGFTVIAGAEYFIGNDPGEGNATALQPKDGAFDSEVESTLTASLSLDGYALGTYLVGVRYKDNNGPGEMCSTKRLKWMSIPMGTDWRTKRKFIMRPIPRCKTPMGTATSTARKSPLAVTHQDANSLGNRAPTDLNATTVLAFWKTNPSGPSSLNLMPPIPMPTTPSPTPLRMGTDRAETFLFHRCERYPAYRRCARL